MARWLLPSRGLLRLKSLASSAASAVISRSYISEMRRSAFRENLLRILRTEIAYEVESRPPSRPAAAFRSFDVDDRPGEQWIKLRWSRGREEIKIEATMFDGAAPSTRSAASSEVADARDARLHISLMVEVSKGDDSELALQFACSAWPDDVEVEKVFPVRRGHAAHRQYMGPDFKELDEEMQDTLLEYLEERGVNDELAGFLHGYMANKDRTELVRWLRNIETYVKK
ncbi:hypothetical protein OPV22_005251 [Ensete ventricosum]|uniref:Mitochondrial glycoprotein n=1 Tax=Ensete ventricosum TaxID=4639 RepID=A0AAV8RNQ9_ENSVE|nr:hypothetical protein OPV22_005251 [Ensete ventricosum]RWW56980.1 hypothetical protein BHE74_00036291 [Ensete ventricosum]RZS12944.1 hypothetical protein BHM03_00044452 [Ensete ventricosum]